MIFLKNLGMNMENIRVGVSLKKEKELSHYSNTFRPRIFIHSDGESYGGIADRTNSTSLDIRSTQDRI